MDLTSAFVKFFRLILCSILLNFTSVFCQRAPSSICPPAEDISPCICSKSCDICEVMIKCSNILNSNQLNEVFRKSTDWTFWTFYIENSTFMYLPSNAIVEKKVRKLYVRDSIMISLFDRAPPSTNKLVEMELTNLVLRSGVKWEVFSKLTNLKELNLTNFEIKKIDQSFIDNFPQGLTGLYLNVTKTKTLGDDAFSKLTELSRLYVRNTQITTLKRSMFAPQSKLLSINFSWNKIRVLPDDLFTNMPELKNIEFSYTNIVVLQESVFRNIMPQISYLYMKGNEIDCNCQMKWLTPTSKPRFTEVVCRKPKALEGLSITDLRSTHFAHCE
ncbi:Slit like protein [Argiope bruennichi]|uniref:Slit like protein n=1 Tax=Argiope bruennichi TaxID=94029 RepID=A0A8T0E9F3_ARGBR|nr:Slit like protein [Argiope bruennichi]